MGRGGKGGALLALRFLELFASASVVVDEVEDAAAAAAAAAPPPPEFNADKNFNTSGGGSDVFF